MKTDKIQDHLVSYFANLGRTVDPGDDLFENNVIDSMGVMELVLFIEESLGVEIQQRMMKAENFRTIEKVAATIREASS